MPNIVPIESVTEKIYLIRGMKVMLDRDLAKLYGVETKVFKQAEKRNINRFPENFMFELTGDEFKNLRSQFVTSSWGGSRYLPMALTEQGVAMLSSVLKSDRAVQVNIQIIRAFIKMRQMYIRHDDLKQKIIALVRKYDKQFQMVFEAIKQLLEQDKKPKRKIDAKWFQSLRSGSRERRPANWKRSVQVVREYFNLRDNAAIGP